MHCQAVVTIADNGTEEEEYANRQAEARRRRREWYERSRKRVRPSMTNQAQNSFLQQGPDSHPGVASHSYNAPLQRDLWMNSYSREQNPAYPRRPSYNAAREGVYHSGGSNGYRGQDASRQAHHPMNSSSENMNTNANGTSYRNTHGSMPAMNLHGSSRTHNFRNRSNPNTYQASYDSVQAHLRNVPSSHQTRHSHGPQEPWSLRTHY